MSSPLNAEPGIKPQTTTAFDLIFRDQEGKIVIAQPPNLPLSVGVVATLVQAILPEGVIQRGVALVAFGALFTWAWQELFSGVNYFRRFLGLAALAGLLAFKLEIF